MEKNVVLDEKTEKILKGLDEIYGIDKYKETIRSYATYLKLRKEEKCDFGDYNIVIKDNTEYDSTSKLINLIYKVLKLNEFATKPIKNFKKEDLEENDEKKKRDKAKKKLNYEEDVFVINMKEMELSIRNYKKQIIDIINKHKDKIFIIVHDCPWIDDAFGDLITWNIEIENYSKENKISYINNFLKQNSITIDKNINITEKLSIRPYRDIKVEMINLLVYLKNKNVNHISNEILSEDFKKKYCKEKKGVKKNSKKELNSMIGMESVKKQIEQIANYIKVNKDKGGTMPSLHMCFLGNPGTGKTTAARIVAKIFSEMNILSDKEKFVEIHGRDLIAKYVGWTADTTKRKVEEATGGVLFIDEAYSLNPKGHNGFEEEAIATLIKEMEDKRDKVCIIFAGYTNEMMDLLKVNPGFESRVQFKINFPDYTEEELYEILKNMAKSEKYKLEKNSKPLLLEYFQYEKCKPNFANGRCARNLFEKVKFEQANRIIKDEEADKNTIQKSDIENVIVSELTQEKTRIKPKRLIGF